MNSHNHNQSSSSNKIEFVEIGHENEIENGERIFVEIDGRPIVVFNIAGELFAISDLCTHDDGPLGDGVVQGHEVSCPRHGANFDVRTGKALTLPAIVDIPTYPLRVINGRVEIGLQRD
ncbi:MAG: non-heme iron oxygenase ferredoxin subunit [Anaerolineales bacterium]|jgi:3-phenylpropionate/trans-cinnamate dioxygenase ferredoxin subunit|nr:non-heme iron oxygenase ferredoxin subunit [Anaerolineales bacterium]